MKFLIVSDSHGLEQRLYELINRYEKEVDAIIHCGDSELSSEQLRNDKLLVVRGNCDFEERFPNEITKEFGQLRLFVTHGHHYRVKMSYVPLSYRADEVAAQLVCFGHSHVAVAFSEQGTIYINPGSLSYPRGRSEKTYCIFEQDAQNKARVMFYDFTTGQEINDLSQQF